MLNNALLKSENKMTLNKFMYALFLGLYLMREDIPQDIQEYVNNYTFKTENPDLFVTFENLIGGTDLTDSILRGMILKTLE